MSGTSCSVFNDGVRTCQVIGYIGRGHQATAEIKCTQREQEKKTDPSQMSDEDLLLMMDEAARTLTEGSD